MRPHRVALAAGLFAIGAALTAACDGRARALPGDGPSPAADALIERAATPEDREVLEHARDEVDAEMRGKLRAMDAEIERLRRENEELRQSLRQP